MDLSSDFDLVRILTVGDANNRAWLEFFIKIVPFPSTAFEKVAIKRPIRFAIVVVDFTR